LELLGFAIRFSSTKFKSKKVHFLQKNRLFFHLLRFLGRF
jgi:hypothetical protein